MAGEHDDIMFSCAHFYWTLNQRRSSHKANAREYEDFPTVGRRVRGLTMRSLGARIVK
jgi:hypothetical protein